MSSRLHIKHSPYHNKNIRAKDDCGSAGPTRSAKIHAESEKLITLLSPQKLRDAVTSQEGWHKGLQNTWNIALSIASFVQLVKTTTFPASTHPHKYRHKTKVTFLNSNWWIFYSVFQQQKKKKLSETPSLHKEPVTSLPDMRWKAENSRIVFPYSFYIPCLGNARNLGILIFWGFQP